VQLGHVIISDSKKLLLPAIIAAFPWTRLLGGEAEKIGRRFRLKSINSRKGGGRKEWGIANWSFLGFKELG
jgi:hypothetical protein